MQERPPEWAFVSSPQELELACPFTSAAKTLPQGGDGERSPTECGTASGEKINDQSSVWELLVQWPHSASAPGLQLEVLGTVAGGQGVQAASLRRVGHLMVAQG